MPEVIHAYASAPGFDADEFRDRQSGLVAAFDAEENAWRLRVRNYTIYLHCQHYTQIAEGETNDNQS